ncbi:hypothetical protein PG990_009624 [Apiospora arundinis]|uniref:DUF221-domain-containing protein n=1 Tax=Apiospora arundinis TaxID=335852 RepID=A0ABR2ITS7_9PEZI
MSDPNIGSARQDNETSLSSLVSTLVPVAVVAGIYLVVFLILRKSQRRYYAPRTYLGSIRESERSPALPTGLFNWIGAFWKIPDTYALQHQSLDAFLFLRFMRIVTTICFVGCCILWPILFPVNATGGGGQTQLSILSYSNIDTSTSGGKNRFYAHCFAAWLFYGFVMYMVLRECIYYINLRQAFLLSPFYANRISSRTVLFVSVPVAYLDESRLRKVFGEDTVKNIWITGETDKLEELVKERDKVAMKLEKAEVKLLKLANGARLKSIKKGGADERTEAAHDAEPGSLSARWVPTKKRPTHRTGTLGLIGKKVDTINWCRSELERLIPEVDAAQTSYRAGSAKKIPSVFIEFFTQSQAESANQVLAHHQALQMTPKYIGITPGEVVWKALRVSWWQRVIRRFAVIAFIAVLIIFWAIPVGVVGIISNVNYLKTIFFLTWLDKIPPVIMGVVSGLLPSVALSILMSLVPVIMRLCARAAGEPSQSRVELFTQNAYFAFQVIQVFLITTMTSAATAVAKQIADNPGSVTTVLAENLPKASNFFIPYFIVQGLGIASGILSQVAGFVIFTLMYKFLTGTPRAMYTKWASLTAISWGSVMPVYTNIVVISLCYAAIAPLVVGFATVGLGLFYLAWRYNILFVTDTTIDTRGLIYPRALKQLFAGIYIAELCMIGLFGASVAIGPLILMIIFTIFTALFHITINSALDPLLYNLPRSLEHEEGSLRLEAQMASGVSGGSTEYKNGHSEPKRELDGPATTTGNGKKPGLFSKFLKPWAHCDYATLRKIVPEDSIDFSNLYSDEVARNAYYPPEVNSPTPLLWIPSDAAGISKQEVRDSGKVIPITDEGCTLNDKNKLEWDTEAVRPPLWEEKIYY